jgi:eukaryotic-like serine/threonine-protein kinase
MGPDTHRAEWAEARVGMVLREKWRLDALLGIGGMAAVYAATHRNGKQAAIKILRPQAAAIKELKTRFLSEGYLANRVAHPGAVSILDDDTDTDGTVFLVMELLHGETLEARWSRSGKIGWEPACLIADRVLDVLIAAHAKQIVHRDLKPGNVFIDARGGIKILDFGIARLQSLAPPLDETAQNLALGTPGFMPPEQARARWEAVDAQSDLWALGATLFTILSGRYVHEGTTVKEQLLAAMSRPAPRLADVAPEVPAALAAVIDHALCYEKAQRFANASSMQQVLRATYATIAGRHLPDTPWVFAPHAERIEVDRGAPTLAASDLEASQPFSSARPVVSRTSARWPAQAAWRRGAAVAVFAGALLSPVILTVTSTTGSRRVERLENSRALARSIATRETAFPRAPAPASDRERAPAEPEGVLAEGPKHSPLPKQAAQAQIRRTNQPALASAVPTAVGSAPSVAEPVDIFARRK